MTKETITATLHVKDGRVYWKEVNPFGEKPEWANYIDPNFDRSKTFHADLKKWQSAESKLREGVVDDKEYVISFSRPCYFSAISPIKENDLITGALEGNTLTDLNIKS